MPSSVRVGGIRADITAKDSGFQAATKRTAEAWKKQRAEMKRTQARAKALNRGFTTLRATLAGVAASAVTAAFQSAAAGAAKEVASLGAALSENATRLNTNAEALLAHRKAFEDDGIAASSFDQVMTAMVRRFGANTGALQKALTMAGVSMEEWRRTGGDMEKMLRLLARTMTDETIPQGEKLNLLQEAGSTQARKFFTALSRGEDSLERSTAAYKSAASGINEVAEELKDLDQVFGDIQWEVRIQQMRTIAGNKERYIEAAKGVAELKLAWLEFLNAIAGPLNTVMGGISWLLENAPGSVGKEFAEENAAELGIMERLRRLRSDEAEVMAYLSTGMQGEALASFQDDLKEIRAAIVQAERELQALRDGEGLAVTVNRDRREPTPTPVAPRGGLSIEDENIAARYRNEVQVAIMERERLTKAAIDGVEAEKMARLELQEEIRRATERTTELNQNAILERLQQWESLKDSIGASIAQSAVDFMKGTASMKEAFGNLASAVIDDLYRIYVVKQITGFIAGAFGGGGESFASVDPQGLASGGPAQAGRPYYVGERGPELFIPETAGVVVPNDRMGGAMGVTQNIGSLIGSIVSNDPTMIRAEIMRAVPAIVEAAEASTLATLANPSAGRQYATGR